MITSPARAVVELLLAHPTPEVSHPGANAAWPIYVSSMPDGLGVKDDVVAAFDTSGVRTSRLLQTGANIMQYGVQLMVRAKNYQQGWAKLMALCIQLETVNWQELVIGTEQIRVQTVGQTSPPLSIGQEKAIEGRDQGTSKRREMFTANFLLTIDVL